VLLHDPGPLSEASTCRLCDCPGMTPVTASRLKWLRMTAPAAFVGYGLYLVTRSVVLAVVVAVGVFLVCRFLLRLQAHPHAGEDEPHDRSV
jgi:hypothetical protein